MLSFNHGRYWYLFIICAILGMNHQVQADTIPNYFSNSTQNPVADTVTEFSTITSALTVTMFTTCFTTATQTSIFTTAHENTTVLSTTTTTKIVTLPPVKLARNMIRAPLTDSPKVNGVQETVTLLTTVTAVTTLTTCGYTVSRTVVVVSTQTQKITVDKLITETQTVFVGGSRSTTTTTTTTSSTQEAIPPVPPVQQVTVTTTTREPNAPAPADPSPSPQSTTTINGIPFTISPVPSNTAVVVNEATILPGEAITTDGVEFSKGPTGLEISTSTSVGAIVASIFGVTTGVVIGGSTLTPGGTLILSGTTYILPTGGTVPAIVTDSFPTSTSPGVPKGGDGGPSATVTGTGSDATPTYIQAAGASKEKLRELSAMLMVLCVGAIQVHF